MQEHCHRCGGELSSGDEGTSFCPHCGAPQLYLPEYDRPSVAAELDSTGAPPPPHPQVVDWKTAIRCAAVVAGIAAALTVLAMGLPGIPALGTIGTFWTLTGAMTAVAFYQRRRPLAKMDVRVGARIGFTTGLALVAFITVAMAAAGVVARFGCTRRQGSMRRSRCSLRSWCGRRRRRPLTRRRRALRSLRGLCGLWLRRSFELVMC